MIINEKDTIAAIATPQGNGAIGIIRISGNAAFKIVKKIFHSKIDFDEIIPNSMVFGKIIEDSQVIDHVMMCKYVAPRSYTGENAVELNCHGGAFIIQKLLETVLNAGARLAQPGEFTQRAFLNGKIDLLQAEAVADLIKSKAEQSQKTSLSQLEGRLSNYLNDIKAKLERVIVLLELDLDFAEDDIQIEKRSELFRQISNVEKQVLDLINSFQKGKILRDGAKLVLVGRPNVGKSSLLNYLLKEDRAIVTEIPGTTRDTLVEQIQINGVLFSLVDTAGIRKSENQIEVLGVNKTLDALKDADIICMIFDGSERLKKEDIYLYNLLEEKFINTNKVFVQNKNDIEEQVDYQIINSGLDDRVIKLSARTGEGIKRLEQKLSDIVLKSDSVNENIVITRQRHKRCLIEAKQYLAHALRSMEDRLSYEFVSADLRGALSALGELFGEVTSLDILNRIFAEFCIGK